MTEAIKSAPIRPLPPAAGQFGERSLADRLGAMAHAHRPAGCPSVDQFERRMAATNSGRGPDRIA